MTDITVFQARKILTMNPMQPEATHVAVRDGKVLAVGDLARMQAWGDFTLDTRSQAAIVGIPTDGSEFTVGCNGAGGTCGATTRS